MGLGLSAVYKRACWLIALLAAVSISACSSMPTAERIPVIEIPAPADNRLDVLVVVLPGRGDRVEDLRTVGVAAAIQASMPEADVMLTGLSMAYYMEGRMPQRLHAEIIQPARERGYREIYLAGASMGGMGVLLYEREHPDSIDGLVLFAPFVGRRGVLNDIREAGGLRTWDPGPKPTGLDADNFDREVWRHLQTWQNDPRRAGDVWLAYGDKDRLAKPVQPLVALLPPAQVLAREGGHTWSVWTPAAKDIFAAIERRRANSEP